MATTDDLLKDIGFITSYLQQLTEMGLDTGDNRAAQAKSLTYKIGTMRSLTIPDSTRILQTLRAGAWTPQELTVFASRLNEKVEATDATQTTTTKRLQTCQTFELYLTVSDWAILNDVATPQCLKIACLVRRALGLGLFWPDASTSSRWACILQLASQTDVGVKGWAQLNVLGQVKRHLRGARTKTPYHLQHLENP